MCCFDFWWKTVPSPFLIYASHVHSGMSLCIYFTIPVWCICLCFYFQGGKIRAKLVAELTGAEGVVIEEGSAGEGGKLAAQNGMRK